MRVDRRRRRAARIQTLWLCITPFERPVVPEVQRIAAVSPRKSSRRRAPWPGARSSSASATPAPPSGERRAASAHHHALERQLAAALGDAREQRLVDHQQLRAAVLEALAQPVALVVRAGRNPDRAELVEAERGPDVGGAALHQQTHGVAAPDAERRRSRPPSRSASSFTRPYDQRSSPATRKSRSGIASAWRSRQRPSRRSRGSSRSSRFTAAHSIAKVAVENRRAPARPGG